MASSGGHHHAKSKNAHARGSGAGDVQLDGPIPGHQSRRTAPPPAYAARRWPKWPTRSRAIPPSGLVAALLAPRTAQAKTQKPSSAAAQEAVKRARAQVAAEAGHRRGRTGPVAPAAAYLGLSEPALRARLQSGSNPSPRWPTAQKRSRQGLIGALVAVKAQRLKTALQEHAAHAGPGAPSAVQAGEEGPPADRRPFGDGVWVVERPRNRGLLKRPERLRPMVQA